MWGIFQPAARPFVCCWETRGLPWSRGSLCSWQNTTKSGDEQRKDAVSSHPRTLAPHQPLIHKSVRWGTESVMGCIRSMPKNWREKSKFITRELGKIRVAWFRGDGLEFNINRVWGRKLHNQWLKHHFVLCRKVECQSVCQLHTGAVAQMDVRAEN